MIGFFRRMWRKVFKSRSGYRYAGGHFSEADAGNFIASRLNDDEARRMRTHIAGCKYCEQLVAETRAKVWREN